MNQNTNHVEDPEVVRRLSDKIVSLFKEIHGLKMSRSIQKKELDDLVKKVQELAKTVMIYEDFHVWIDEMTCPRQDDLSETKLQLGQLLESKSSILLKAWQRAWRNGKTFTFEKSLRGIPSHPYLSSLLVGL